MKYSIYIPQVGKEITKNFIYSEIDYHLLGKIDKIDLVFGSHKYNMAFVHFSEWNTRNETANKIKTQLDAGSYCHIFISDFKVYWKLLKKKSSSDDSISSNKMAIKKISPVTSDKSVFTDLIKIDNELSLFDKIIESSRPSFSNNNNNSDNPKLKDLEERISKLENYIYNNLLI